MCILWQCCTLNNSCDIVHTVYDVPVVYTLQQLWHSVHCVHCDCCGYCTTAVTYSTLWLWFTLYNNCDIVYTCYTVTVAYTVQYIWHSVPCVHHDCGLHCTTAVTQYRLCTVCTLYNSCGIVYTLYTVTVVCNVQQMCLDGKNSNQY